ncbi:hypothetical protein Tco_1235405 [Tanacetum coccineum]
MVKLTSLFLDKKNQNQAPTPVKAVEQSCVTCRGAHSYRNCPATDGNVYRDNIQEYVSQAAAANFNQGNTNSRPPMVANQIRPPGDDDSIKEYAKSKAKVYKQNDNLTEMLSRFVNSYRFCLSLGSLPRNIDTTRRKIKRYLLPEVVVAVSKDSILLLFPKVVERRTS